MARKLVFLSLFMAVFALPLHGQGQKLIALTFDDGPRPEILMGDSGLLNVLDKNQVKATFFAVGWRLEPYAGCEKKNPFCISCREAVAEAARRGHEIENHTYGHGPLSQMEKRYGTEWVFKDIDRCSRIIREVTGVAPHFVRPPNWDINPFLKEGIEARGYHVMSKSIHGIKEPAALEDVDSEDYFCTGLTPSKCPKPNLHDSFVIKIEQRERRVVFTHIVVFHELKTSVQVLEKLIPELQTRGYRFVLLKDYMVSEGSK